ncbi:hypothetical protein HOH87_08550 [bacterium]|jgi:hypothetical protein|nr:hypothetical protein [bacterium]
MANKVISVSNIIEGPGFEVSVGPSSTSLLRHYTPEECMALATGQFDLMPSAMILNIAPNLFNDGFARLDSKEVLYKGTNLLSIIKPLQAFFSHLAYRQDLPIKMSFSIHGSMASEVIAPNRVSPSDVDLLVMAFNTRILAGSDSHGTSTEEQGMLRDCIRDHLQEGINSDTRVSEHFYGTPPDNIWETGGFSCYPDQRLQDRDTLSLDVFVAMLPKQSNTGFAHTSFVVSLQGNMANPNQVISLCGHAEFAKWCLDEKVLFTRHSDIMTLGLLKSYKYPEWGTIQPSLRSNLTRAFVNSILVKCAKDPSFVSSIHGKISRFVTQNKLGESDRTQHLYSVLIEARVEAQTTKNIVALNNINYILSTFTTKLMPSKPQILDSTSYIKKLESIESQLNNLESLPHQNELKPFIQSIMVSLKEYEWIFKQHLAGNVRHAYMDMPDFQNSIPEFDSESGISEARPLIQLITRRVDMYQSILDYKLNVSSTPKRIPSNLKDFKAISKHSVSKVTRREVCQAFIEYFQGITKQLADLGIETWPTLANRFEQQVAKWQRRFQIIWDNELPEQTKQLNTLINLISSKLSPSVFHNLESLEQLKKCIVDLDHLFTFFEPGHHNASARARGMSMIAKARLDYFSFEKKFQDNRIKIKDVLNLILSYFSYDLDAPDDLITRYQETQGDTAASTKTLQFWLQDLESYIVKLSGLNTDYMTVNEKRFVSDLNKLRVYLNHQIPILIKQEVARDAIVRDRQQSVKIASSPIDDIDYCIRCLTFINRTKDTPGPKLDISPLNLEYIMQNALTQLFVSWNLLDSPIQSDPKNYHKLVTVLEQFSTNELVSIETKAFWTFMAGSIAPLLGKSRLPNDTFVRLDIFIGLLKDAPKDILKIGLLFLSLTRGTLFDDASKSSFMLVNKKINAITDPFIKHLVAIRMSQYLNNDLGDLDLSNIKSAMLPESIHQTLQKHPEFSFTLYVEMHGLDSNIMIDSADHLNLFVELSRSFINESGDSSSDNIIMIWQNYMSQRARLFSGINSDPTSLDVPGFLKKMLATMAQAEGVFLKRPTDQPLLLITMILQDFKSFGLRITHEDVSDSLTQQIKIYMRFVDALFDPSTDLTVVDDFRASVLIYGAELFGSARLPVEFGQYLLRVLFEHSGDKANKKLLIQTITCWHLVQGLKVAEPYESSSNNHSQSLQNYILYKKQFSFQENSIESALSHLLNNMGAVMTVINIKGVNVTQEKMMELLDNSFHALNHYYSFSETPDFLRAEQSQNEQSHDIFDSINRSANALSSLTPEIFAPFRVNFAKLWCVFLTGLLFPSDKTDTHYQKKLTDSSFFKYYSQNMVLNGLIDSTSLPTDQMSADSFSVIEHLPIFVNPVSEAILGWVVDKTVLQKTHDVIFSAFEKYIDYFFENWTSSPSQIEELNQILSLMPAVQKVYPSKFAFIIHKVRNGLSSDSILPADSYSRYAQITLSNTDERRHSWSSLSNMVSVGVSEGLISRSNELSFQNTMINKLVPSLQTMDSSTLSKPQLNDSINALEALPFFAENYPEKTLAILTQLGNSFEEMFMDEKKVLFERNITNYIEFVGYLATYYRNFLTIRKGLLNLTDGFYNDRLDAIDTKLSTTLQSKFDRNFSAFLITYDIKSFEDVKSVLIFLSNIAKISNNLDDNFRDRLFKKVLSQIVVLLSNYIQSPSTNKGMLKLDILKEFLSGAVGRYLGSKTQISLWGTVVRAYSVYFETTLGTLDNMSIDSVKVRGLFRLAELYAELETIAHDSVEMIGATLFLNSAFAKHKDRIRTQLLSRKPYWPTHSISNLDSALCLLPPEPLSWPLSQTDTAVAPI